MAHHDRWFLVPAAQDTEGGWYPKYSDDPDISGLAGNTFTTGDLEGYGYGWVVHYLPSSGPWCVVRMYGEGEPGAAALDSVGGHDDAIKIPDVTELLDQRFGVSNWKFEIN